VTACLEGRDQESIHDILLGSLENGWWGVRFCLSSRYRYGDARLVRLEDRLGMR
jgi:hypothetical protein